MAARRVRTFSEMLQEAADRAGDGFADRPAVPPRVRRPPPPRGRVGAVPPEHRAVALVAGEGFRWLGLPHRLRLVDDGPDARFARDGFGRWVELRRGCGAGAVTSLYTGEGLQYLTGDTGYSRRVREYAQRAGVREYRFEVRDLGERPARCFAARGLAVLHWAVFSLEPRLVEYQASALLVHIAAGHCRRDHEWWRIMQRLWFGEATRLDDKFKLAWAAAWTGAVES